MSQLDQCSSVIYRQECAVKIATFSLLELSECHIKNILHLEDSGIVDQYVHLSVCLFDMLCEFLPLFLYAWCELTGISIFGRIAEILL